MSKLNKKQNPFYFALKTSFGFILSLGFLFFTIKDSSFNAFLLEINHINIFYLIISISFFIISLFIKAWRWKTITRLNNLYLYDYSLYFLLAHILPYNTGELLRISLFAKHGLTYPTLVGNIFLEKVYDVLSMLALTLIIVLFFKNIILIKFTISIMALMFLIGIFCLFICNNLSNNNILKKTFRMITAGLLFNKKHLEIHLKISTITIVLRALAIISLLFCLIAININLDIYLLFICTLFVNIITTFSFLVPSSLGGLGIVQASTVFSFWVFANSFLKQESLYKALYSRILLVGHVLWLMPIMAITMLVLYLSIINLFKKGNMTLL